MTVATRSSTGYRTAPAVAAFVALILVLAFGNAAFHDWANKQNPHSAGGLFWQTLAWPTWHINGSAPVQNLIADDLKAILLIVLTFVFVLLLCGAQLAAARGTLSQFFAGWAGYVFAGAAAGLLAAWLLEHASLYNALLWAVGGAAYGLIVGWIIGLATFGARR
jgi:hypothetical protein